MRRVLVLASVVLLASCTSNPQDWSFPLSHAVFSHDGGGEIPPDPRVLAFVVVVFAVVIAADLVLLPVTALHDLGLRVGAW